MQQVTEPPRNKSFAVFIDNEAKRRTIQCSSSSCVASHIFHVINALIPDYMENAFKQYFSLYSNYYFLEINKRSKLWSNA